MMFVETISVCCRNGTQARSL